VKKTMDGKMAFYHECCFPNSTKITVNKFIFVGSGYCTAFKNVAC